MSPPVAVPVGDVELTIVEVRLDMVATCKVGPGCPCCSPPSAWVRATDGEFTFSWSERTARDTWESARRVGDVVVVGPGGLKEHAPEEAR
jgi:hypothetical protein